MSVWWGADTKKARQKCPTRLESAHNVGDADAEMTSEMKRVMGDARKQGPEMNDGWECNASKIVVAIPSWFSQYGKDILTLTRFEL